MHGSTIFENHKGGISVTAIYVHPINVSPTPSSTDGTIVGGLIANLYHMHPDLINTPMTTVGI